VRKVRRWISELIDEPGEAASALAILGIVSAVGGYIFLYGWGSFTQLVSDFYANAATELLSIAITVLIIDRLYARRSANEEKDRIIRQLASPSNEFALEAVRLASERRWLYDHSLMSANLRRANLEGADLTNANLIIADLPSANLAGADLAHATLVGANLAYANLEGADLPSANLAGAVLWAANLEGAYLGDAGLRGADLSLAKLDGAYLEDAGLKNAVLEFAKLKGANLMRAKLEGADLRRANLEGAYLEDAGLRGADLGFANLEGAKCNNQTTWPEGFDYRAAGVINVDDKGESESE